MNKVVVPPSPPVKMIEGPVKKEPKKISPKTNDASNTPKHNINPFNHLNISSLKGFTGQNLTRNFQRTNQKRAQQATNGLVWIKHSCWFYWLKRLDNDNLKVQINNS